MTTKMFKRMSTDEPIDWSKKGRTLLKQKIKKLGLKGKGRVGLEPPRILFIGETGSGKSSFISSIVSALKGEIIYTSTIGEKEGDEVNTSKRFLEHRVFMDEDDSKEGDEPLNFILCDSRGIAKKNQQGAAEKEIQRLIDGKLRHGDMIEAESGTATESVVDARASRPPSCVVFVQKAQLLGERDDDVRKKLDLVSRLVRERGIPSCVVLTHIDKVKQSLTHSSLDQALSSRKIQEHVKTASKLTGVNKNRVFVIKNYVDEGKVHRKQDILILRALYGILVDVDQKNDDNFARASTSLTDPEKESGQFTSRDLPLPGKAFHTRRGSLSALTDLPERTPSFQDSGLPTSVPSSHPSHPFQESHIDSHFTSISQQHQPQQLGDDSNRISGRRRQKGATDLKHNQQYASQTTKEAQPSRASMNTVRSSRSGAHDYHIRGTETFSENIEESESSIDTADYSLEKCIEDISKKPYPAEYLYREVAPLRGAKPFHRHKVWQARHFSNSSDDESRLAHQLQKQFLREDYFKNIHSTLVEWMTTSTAATTNTPLSPASTSSSVFAETKSPALSSSSKSLSSQKSWTTSTSVKCSGAVWMSDTLAMDFSLPVDLVQPESMEVQAFILVPDQPAVLLTVYDPVKVLQGQHIPREEESRAATSEERQSVEGYTLQMTKLLTSALLNYCCCDFILLPCCLEFKGFHPNTLRDEIDRQMSTARSYYSGPMAVREGDSYDQLKAAATAVVSASYVPWLLNTTTTPGTSLPLDQAELLLLDRDWQGVVSLLLENLTRDHGHVEDVTSPPAGRDKLLVAVMETAKRLSFTEHVVIVTEEDKLIQRHKDLLRKVRDDTGMDLMLSVERPGNQFPNVGWSSVSCAILIDCPHLKRQVPEGPVLLCVNFLNISTV